MSGRRKARRAQVLSREEIIHRSQAITDISRDKTRANTWKLTSEGVEFYDEAGIRRQVNQQLVHLYNPGLVMAQNGFEHASRCKNPW